MQLKSLKLQVCAMVFLLFYGCTKFVQVSPPVNRIESSAVYQSDASALSAMDGIYSQMSSSIGFASGSTGSVSVLSGLSADEFTNYSTSVDQTAFYTNSLTPSNGYNQSYLWGEIYKYIYGANSVVSGASASTSLSDPVKRELLGQAKFLRAFCYFYLVNLYGDIPLVLSTDYNVNVKMSRMAVANVYTQILTDLNEASSVLPDDYAFSNGERIRPNKSAVVALMARVYLYSGDWQNAEKCASTLIANTGLYTLVTDLNEVFQKNSSEAIWQLMPVITGNNTNEGSLFILSSTPTVVSLSPQIMNGFEAGDGRKTQWTGQYNQYYFPFKYKIKLSGQPLTEYSMVLRLAEQYLIRAEARSRQNNISGAQDDINAIRTRAGLPPTTAADAGSLLLAIEQERKAEFFSEWGHRWLDLKRTGRADLILAPVKGNNWQTTDVLYPIPQNERNTDTNLSQNAGY